MSAEAATRVATTAVVTTRLVGAAAAGGSFGGERDDCCRCRRRGALPAAAAARSAAAARAGVTGRVAFAAAARAWHSPQRGTFERRVVGGAGGGGMVGWRLRNGGWRWVRSGCRRRRRSGWDASGTVEVSRGLKPRGCGSRGLCERIAAAHAQQAARHLARHCRRRLLLRRGRLLCHRRQGGMPAAGGVVRARRRQRAAAGCSSRATG